MSGGKSSMLHNPPETKNYKVHGNYPKKNREKLNPRKESYHRSNHHSVSDRSSEYAPLKFKLKINASKGKVEVINTITSDHLSSLQSSVSPKPGKPKKPEKEYLNVRISQDVALANEPVHCGIADSVKTKKRRCKDQGGDVHSPERTRFSWDTPLMLSPKKRKSRKNIETSVSPKKWKPDPLLNQKLNGQNDRKSLGTSVKLYKEQDKKWSSRELYKEHCKKKKSSRQLYDRQDSKKNLWASNELYNEHRKSLGNSRELYSKHHNSKNSGISKELYKRIETKRSIISYPAFVLKREVIDQAPASAVTTSIVPNPTLIIKREVLDNTPTLEVTTSSSTHSPTLIIKRETLDEMPTLDVTTTSIIPNLVIKRRPMPTADVTSIIPNLVIKREALDEMPILDVAPSYNIPNPTLILKREAFDEMPILDVTTSCFSPNPALVPKKEALDLTPPFDLIFEIEKELSEMCNTVGLEKVESTVTDPIFKNITTKFQESSEMVVSEYLAEGYPNAEEIEKVSFEPVLAKKVCQEAFHPSASPGNVFLSCASSQELVIASYEDAVEVEMKIETSSHCSESPPYGSQDSGYTSMTSPLSDDPERLSSPHRKHVNKADQPLCLTDVQFLKMCHNYCGSSKKWTTKKLVNSHNYKTSLQFSKIPTTKKNYQLSMIKIVSSKSVPHEEPRKEFSPRGNERAKALHDRRVVYLGNIPSSYTEYYIREKFKRFGEIEHIQIKSKESDELDLVNNRSLASRPLKGNGRNSKKGNGQREKIMKHFGFVTFKKIAVAREVFERRRELCTWAGGSINYGGRREFVQEDYADFDAETNNLNPGCSYKQNQENEVDYTQLLKKEQEKRGLIISPNSKRPQHSV